MINIADPGSVGLLGERLDRVTTWLNHQIDSDRLAGCSVLIGRHGQVGYLETAGHADLASGLPFERGTIVRIYSMTKPITTVAAMMLYEQGCFQLDDPIAQYLPEFSDMRVWSGGTTPLDQTNAATAPITVKHIMTHTSGLTYGFMQANAVDAEYRQLGIDFSSASGTLSEMVGRLAALPLICQPGSAWNYSVSTDVLGRLVEVWSGRTLKEFFDTEILAPLSMVDTGFHVAESNHHRFATMYAPLNGGDLSTVGRARQVQDIDSKRVGTRVADQAASSRYLQPTTLYSGGGGLVGTISDYARFCQMLLNGGAIDGSRILARTTVEHMRANHLPNNADMAAMGQPVWSETSYNGIGFGLGFAVVLDPVKAQFISSPGEHHWGGAASTFFWLDPREDLYVVFFTQLMPSSAYPIRRELRTLVYQALI